MSSQYDIEREIGSGAQGIVYLALQVSLGRRVALKSLRPDLLDDPGARERFQREMVQLSHLRHPNIVRVYDCGFEEGRPFFTMELLEGHSLYEFSKKNQALSFPQIRKILQGIAAGLAELHRNGLVHRDIKRGNVFLDQDLQPKLLDLGLVRNERMIDVTGPGVVVGTVRYLAPELLLPFDPHPPQDVYALGALMWELVSGSPFFDGANSVTIFEMIRHGRIQRVEDLRPDTPEPLACLIHECLDADWRRRPTASEVRDRLDRMDPRKRVGRRVAQAVRSVRHLLGENSSMRGGLVISLFLGLFLAAALGKKSPPGPRPVVPSRAGAETTERTPREWMGEVIRAGRNLGKTPEDIVNWTAQDRSRVRTACVDLASCMEYLEASLHQTGGSLERLESWHLVHVLLDVGDMLHNRRLLTREDLPREPELAPLQARFRMSWTQLVKIVEEKVPGTVGSKAGKLLRAHFDGGQERSPEGESGFHRLVAQVARELSGDLAARSPEEDCWIQCWRIDFLAHSRIHVQNVHPILGPSSLQIDRNLADLEARMIEEFEGRARTCDRKGADPWTVTSLDQVWQIPLDRLKKSPDELPDRLRDLLGRIVTEITERGLDELDPGALARSRAALEARGRLGR